MIFWIVLGIAIAVTLYVFVVSTLMDDVAFGALMWLLAVVMSALIGFLVLVFASIWVSPSKQPTNQNTYDLVALQTSNSVEGRSYFLGSGYIDGKRTLNYITNEGGAFRVESADADASVIYQRPGQPTVTVYEWEFVNPWLVPFHLGTGETFEFRIPTGSILSDYTVGNS